jgi:hypothetical protein
MKTVFAKLAMAGALVAVMAVTLAPSAGAATLRQRVNKLENKVATLQKENACLVRYGLSEWDGYAPYAGGDGNYAYDPFASVPAANLDLVFGDTSPPNIWVVATRNTRFCRGAYSRGVDPFASAAARTAEDAPAHLSKLRT